MLIATANTGFYVGLSLAFVAVAVVVLLVSWMLMWASRIADQAELAATVMIGIRDSTDALPDIAQTNEHALAILQGAKTARGALTG
jgi:hypothetical protein